MPNLFHGLPKIQAAIYVITKPLDIDQCGMPLITVIYILRYTQSFQRHHPAYAKQYFLF
jgi:hypothetical protein